MNQIKKLFNFITNTKSNKIYNEEQLLNTITELQISQKALCEDNRRLRESIVVIHDDNIKLHSSKQLPNGP